MTKIPEPIVARSNENVTKRIASDADKSSQRKTLIMDALERRSRTHLAQSSAL